MYVIGWWHDLDIKHHTRCFMKIKKRDRLAWRNKMIKNQRLLKIKMLGAKILKSRKSKKHPKKSQIFLVSVTFLCLRYIKQIHTLRHQKTAILRLSI